MSPKLNQLSESGHGQNVLVWDHRRSRLQLVSRVITECGARPRWVESTSAVTEIGFPTLCNLAVVALGDCPSPDGLGLDVICTLRRGGFKVICYEDGAQAWPLSMQCRALLAGALGLLDSGKSEFAQELRRSLTKFLRAEASRWEEEQQITELMNSHGVVGKSPAMISVFRWVMRVSKLSDLPVLITGETGTGKQLLAYAIHQLDPKRRKGAFVAVNCGAISPGLAESELFGYRRGAYTGAHQDRRGLIRSAEGGILFLDEIGELSDDLQAKLLRVVQESRVLAVGEDREVPINVRIIVATNRNLQVMVREKEFREDLFHRLNVLSIHIPPLRERPADIRPMVDHFLKKHRSLNPAQSPSAGPDFLEALTQVEMPGNIRELENLVRHALVNKDDEHPLTLSDLPPEVWHELAERSQSPRVQTDGGGEGTVARKSTSEGPLHGTPTYLVSLLEANGWDLSRSIRYCERLLLEATLHMAQGNQSHAARLLGITPRSVYNKIRKHDLRV